MYRYTLKVIGPEGKLDARAIKAALDRRLLFAPRPVTFRFGKTAQVDSTLLVELATDLSRAALLDLLRPLEPELAIRLESVGWGWILSDAAPGDARMARGGDLSHDVYAFVEPQQEAKRVYTYGARQPLRLAMSIAVALFLVFIVLFGILLDTPLREWIRARDYVWFFVWIPLYVVTSVYQIQLSPLIFVSAIRCAEDGIEIKYWFRQPIRIGWLGVTELDVTFELATLRSSGRLIKFPITENLGMAQAPTLIKTILSRASLHYVGYVPRKGAVYMCFDAE
jgi:hypothetical protein